MLGVSHRLLWIVVAAFFTCMSATARVEESIEQFVLSSSINGHPTEKGAYWLTHCMNKNAVTVINATIQKTAYNAGCTHQKLITSDQRSITLITSYEDEPTKIYSLDVPNENTGWIAKYEKLILFLAGMLSVALAKSTTLLFQPLLNWIFLKIKVYKTKKNLSVFLDTFEPEFVLSEQIRAIAVGKYTSNFLISPKLIAECRSIRDNVDLWKKRDITGRELAERLNLKIRV